MDSSDFGRGFHLVHYAPSNILVRLNEIQGWILDVFISKTPDVYKCQMIVEL